MEGSSNTTVGMIPTATFDDPFIGWCRWYRAPGWPTVAR